MYKWKKKLFEFHKSVVILGNIFFSFFSIVNKNWKEIFNEKIIPTMRTHYKSSSTNNSLFQLYGFALRVSNIINVRL